MKNRFNGGVSSDGQFHDPPTGLDIIRLSLAEIVEWLLVTSGIKAA